MPSSDKSSSIIFDRVCLTRGKKVLLSEVSLTLSEKRIGLIGNNGSGKSSFVRLLNGLLKPDKGNLIVHEIDANKSPEGKSVV